MPTFISGLPVHVLVVHAVVVLVPLAVLGAVAVTALPAARRRYGMLVLAVTAVATASIPLATESGEGLERSLPSEPLVAAHTRLGDQLLPFVALMLAGVAALLVLDRVRARQEPGGGPGTTALGTRTWVRPVGLLVSAAVIVLAVVSVVQVVRIGDSGARAAWSDVTYLR